MTASGRLSRKIWVCERSVRRWCRSFWTMTRRSGAWRCVRTFSSISKLSQTCCRESSLVISFGSSSMIRRPSARAFSGSVRRCRGQRKQDSRGPKSKLMLIASTWSSCHRVRQSTSMSIKKSCDACFVQCARRDASCGRTMHDLLHQDNAPAHNAPSIRQFLTERNVTVLDHPPYSPDLAPCFFLFPKLKDLIKGVRFPDMEAIKKAVTTELNRIPEESFQECMEAWQNRMRKCVRLEGDYFEGENL